MKSTKPNRPSRIIVERATWSTVAPYITLFIFVPLLLLILGLSSAIVGCKGGLEQTKLRVPEKSVLEDAATFTRLKKPVDKRHWREHTLGLPKRTEDRLDDIEKSIKQIKVLLETLKKREKGIQVHSHQSVKTLESDMKLIKTHIVDFDDRLEKLEWQIKELSNRSRFIFPTIEANSIIIRDLTKRVKKLEEKSEPKDKTHSNYCPGPLFLRPTPPKPTLAPTNGMSPTLAEIEESLKPAPKERSIVVPKKRPCVKSNKHHRSRYHNSRRKGHR